MNIKSCCIGAALWLCLAPALHAQGLLGGFMQGAGRTTVALSYSGEWYDKYYIANRETTNPGLGTISTSSVNMYAVSGITSWLDVVANVPWVRASSNAGFWAPVGGLQDLSFALRARPYYTTFDDGQLDVMVAGAVGFPATNYPTDQPVTVGHGATSIDGRVIVQYRAWSGPFISAQAGYIGRGKVSVDRGFDVDVPDAFEITARAGMALTSWYADVWVQSQVAQSGTSIGPGVAFPSNGQSFVRVGGTLVYNLVQNFSLMAGVAGTLDGRNVGQATRVSGGIIYNLPVWGGL